MVTKKGGILPPSFLIFCAECLLDDCKIGKMSNILGNPRGVLLNPLFALLFSMKANHGCSIMTESVNFHLNRIEIIFHGLSTPFLIILYHICIKKSIGNLHKDEGIFPLKFGNYHILLYTYCQKNGGCLSRQAFRQLFQLRILRANRRRCTHLHAPFQK